ncbi:two-component system, NarL family, sensor histidine kinase DesK [Microbacterium pygmaeum]|uniref:Two-component system, NarL family, sensor histidine kinase DesK n=1 Tax=Microbacterium pygmaeum TaxID=370764 RepID=A0A1G8B172_9MICO|nr:two-component system, NarL family, sensor histidine kinase DesK [Microbacterium pygmaeum]
MTAILFFEVVIVGLWAAALLEVDRRDATLAVVTVGGLVWSASTVPLLLDYRHRVEGTAALAHWRRLIAPLLVAVAYGVAAGVVTGVWVIAVLPVLQSLVLLNWQPGVRLRIVLAVTVVLGLLAFIDGRMGAIALSIDPDAPNWWFPAAYTALLPAMTVVSLWWWDVLLTLDRARASEARLAATQERLRVATDVHDLQGHHLQVIALQLELAERLMERDPPAALEQLRASRISVDEARQGTRDLVLRFRSVPLGDELANAVDLLRAAGTSAELTVDPDAAKAPASVLGPVIRETTTNVLRHGAGTWARLSLTRTAEGWRYAISNDAGGEHPADQGGSGLDGLRRRAADAGGVLDVRSDKQEFTVVMTIPLGPEDAP